MAFQVGNRGSKYETHIDLRDNRIDNADGGELRSRSSRSGSAFASLDPAFEWIVLFAIVVATGAWLNRSKFAGFFQTYDKKRSQAFEILRERYAKGEISREEYLRIANDLDRHGMYQGSDDPGRGRFFPTS